MIGPALMLIFPVFQIGCSIASVVCQIKALHSNESKKKKHCNDDYRNFIYRCSNYILPSALGRNDVSIACFCKIEQKVLRRLPEHSYLCTLYGCFLFGK